MKRIGVIIVSLLCVLFSSCQKEDPMYLLIGTWEVSSTSTYIYGNSATTVENNVFHCVFEEGGEGRIINPRPSFELLDMNDYYFTYSYDKEKGTIVFESWAGKDKFSWIVDYLTNVSFTCHTSSDVSHTTYNGRKMK